jgi:hypothetical protein
VAKGHLNRVLLGHVLQRVIGGHAENVLRSRHAHPIASRRQW